MEPELILSRCQIRCADLTYSEITWVGVHLPGERCLAPAPPLLAPIRVMAFSVVIQTAYIIPYRPSISGHIRALVS